MWRARFIFYAMSPESRNKGYMYNAIRLIENKYLVTLTTVVDSRNVASMRVLACTTIKANKLDTYGQVLFSLSL